MGPVLRRAWLPVALAAVPAAAYLALHPPSTDLAAHLYRASLFRREGFAIWDGNWYGGHHVPGYSVLFPALSSVLRPRLAGALAAVAAAAAFAALARRHWSPPASGRAAAAAAWFGLGTATLLLTGRLTFGAGVAAGLGALWLWQRWGAAAGAAGAVLTGLLSPVAALFLAIAGVATRRRGGVLLAAAALVPPLVVTVLFPEGGTEPFPLGTAWPVLLACAAAALGLPAEERALRTGAVLYALLTLGCLLVPSPIGSNAARLGPLVAGPIAAGVYAGRRPRLLAALALPLLIWQWSNAVRDVRTAHGDPSTRAAYYTGVRAFLERGLARRPGRVEVPFTRNHWEAALLASHVPLARGWERQLDRRLDPLFYAPALSAGAYRRWLERLAVRFVALPDVRLDATGAGEARLLRAGLPWLRPVYRDAHWRVWALRHPAPLARGAATATALGNDSVELRATRAGAATVQVRWTPYWALSAGRGCVHRRPDGFTALSVRAPGRVRLVTRFALARAFSDAARCR